MTLYLAKVAAATPLLKGFMMFMKTRVVLTPQIQLPLQNPAPWLSWVLAARRLCECAAIAKPDLAFFIKALTSSQRLFYFIFFRRSRDKFNQEENGNLQILGSLVVRVFIPPQKFFLFLRLFQFQFFNLQKPVQLADTRGMAHFAEGLRLDLPDAFARDAKLLADFLKRARIAVAEAE